jgi:hypothetical protein
MEFGKARVVDRCIVDRWFAASSRPRVFPTPTESRLSLSRLPFRSSAQASGAQASGRRVPAFKPSIKTLINHFDLVFGDSALKPFKSASSGGVYFRVPRVPSDSDLDSDNMNSTKQHVSTVLAQVRTTPANTVSSPPTLPNYFL